MRVLQLTVHFSPNIGGVETHLDDLVSGLIQKGFEIFVLTYKPLTAKVKSQIWETKSNLKILRLPWLTGYFYKLVQSPILEFLYLLPGIFLITPLILFLFRPQVIHTHGLVAGFVGVFWGKIFGIKTITTTHSMYHFPKAGIYRNFAKWIFDNSSDVLSLSKLSKAEITNLGIDSEKIHVFTYWIDLNNFKKVSEAKVKVGWGGKFIVLYVGRLVKEKGILVLLESSKTWNKNMYLAIAGTGPLEEEIHNQSLVAGNILFLGNVNNRELPLYYSASDLTIVPSIHDEGFGRVILESLACGTPVIAANRGAIPEAMDKTVGSLIDISPTSVSKELTELYKKKDKIRGFSQNARSFANNKYSLKNIHTIINLYE